MLSSSGLVIHARSVSGLNADTDPPEAAASLLNYQPSSVAPHTSDHSAAVDNAAAGSNVSDEASEQNPESAGIAGAQNDEEAAEQTTASTAESASSVDSPAEGALAAGLARILGDCLANGYSAADKELRNTVLVVVQLLAESRQYRAALCQEEMLTQLLQMGTEPELGDCSTSYLKVRLVPFLPLSKSHF